MAVVGCSVLIAQFSVGLSNDWLDAARDRETGRQDKPVAARDISETAVRNASLIAVCVGALLTLLVGIPATIAHVVFIAAGWAYNLGLKKTVVSVLPYIVGFGALPAVVTLARASPVFPSWWALVAGAALGVSAHFSNALPDLEQDRATGVIGLPQRVGPRASSLIALAALAVATGAIVVGAGMTSHTVGLAIIAAEAITIAGGTILTFANPQGRSLFRVVILAALIAVASLAFSGSQLSR